MLIWLYTEALLAVLEKELGVPLLGLSLLLPFALLLLVFGVVGELCKGPWASPCSLP